MAPSHIDSLTKRIVLHCIIAFAGLAVLSSCATIDAGDELELAFLAFGDSGYVTDRPNGSGLEVVAGAMQHFCQTTDCDFATMAGDNIYPRGADGDPESGADAARFKQVFDDPFGKLGEGNDDFRIYIALGNHDWLTSRAGAFAQIAFHEKTRPFHMNGPFYSVRPLAGHGKVEIFVIDTEMLLAPTRLDEVKIVEDGSVSLTGDRDAGGSANALPQTEREKNQLQWLRSALKNSPARWKIVLAHHPLWESKGSKFEQAQALRGMLLPVLCRYADAYIAGHQHTMEVHEAGCAEALPGAAVQPLAHIVSGAASKQRSINPSFRDWQSRQYPQLNNLWAWGSVWGFSQIEISGDDLHVRMFTMEDGETDAEAYSEVFSHHFSNRAEMKP